MQIPGTPNDTPEQAKARGEASRQCIKLREDFQCDALLHAIEIGRTVPGDAQELRAMAARRFQQFMDIAEQLAAVERITSDDWQALLASSLKYHKVAAKALQELESKCTTQRSDS